MSPDSSGIPTPTTMVEGLKPLPPLASVLSRLQQLLASSDSGLDDIANLIRLDPALTTRVIQISNSVWFRRGLPVNTIGEAVNRVGFREVYRMVGVVASSAMVAQPLVAYNRTAHDTWRESVACAFASEMLAERLGDDMPGSYMTGLFHQIGRLPINQYVLTEVRGKQLVDESFPHDCSGSEYALLGFTQADVAAQMLEKWGFLPAVIKPIYYQYTPFDTPEPHDRMAAVLNIARWLRTVICQNLQPDELPIDEEILSVLRFNRDQVLELIIPLKAQLTRALQMTKD